MRPVSVSWGAFWFCRIGVAVLLWTGFFLKMQELIVLSFLILLFSFILGVDKAPMIVLYSLVERQFIKRPKTTMLEKNSMRFAHGLGTVFALVCVVCIYLKFPYAWGVVALFALVKTLSACGICPAEKLYGCIGGQCCMSKKKDCKIK